MSHVVLSHAQRTTDVKLTIKREQKIALCVDISPNRKIVIQIPQVLTNRLSILFPSLVTDGSGGSPVTQGLVSGISTVSRRLRPSSRRATTA